MTRWLCKQEGEKERSVKVCIKAGFQSTGCYYQRWGGRIQRLSGQEFFNVFFSREKSLANVGRLRFSPLPLATCFYGQSFFTGRGKSNGVEKQHWARGREDSIKRTLVGVEKREMFVEGGGRVVGHNFSIQFGPHKFQSFFRPSSTTRTSVVCKLFHFQKKKRRP